MLPAKNYVLVKRFTSKEQKRRLHAAVLMKYDFPYDCIGLENHVNYIYRPRGVISPYEAYGLAAILNTELLDNYFRAINGNTQVNATEIRDLPLPSIEIIIGKVAFQYAQNKKCGFELEKEIYRILGLEPNMTSVRQEDE